MRCLISAKIHSFEIQFTATIFGFMRAWLLTLSLTLFLGGYAQADALRCGNKLVSTGSTRTLVRELCGEPYDVVTRSILRRPHYDLHGRIIYFGDGMIEVPVEIWTYNFGPYKLMRRIRVVDGLVEDIETVGSGYR